MRKNTVIDLPKDYALVLQQIQEDNGGDFTMLSETLSIRHSRLSHIISALRQKGLVSVSGSNFGEMWIRLSSRGNKLVKSIWPETMLGSAA